MNMKIFTYEVLKLFFVACATGYIALAIVLVALAIYHFFELLAVSIMKFFMLLTQFD